MKKIRKLLNSKFLKITGIVLGSILLIIGVSFILKSCGSNEKKINFTISVPAAPNLEKQETYNAAFKTSPFTLWIASSQFHIDVLDENIKQVIATINFSHPIDPNEFEKRISLKPYKLDTEIQTFKNKDYQFSITYDDFYSKAYILSEPLPIPEDDVQMELTIEKGAESSWKGNRKLSEVSTKVTVPGMLNIFYQKIMKSSLG